MKTKQDCIPCITRQLIRLSKKATNRLELQDEIIKEGLHILADTAFTASSPYVTGNIYHLVRTKSRCHDLFDEEKHYFNQVAQALIDDLGLRQMIEKSDHPLETALRLSIAGNIIDFGIGKDIDKSHVEESIQLSLSTPLFGNTIDDFQNDIINARKILYLADNAGEIVFDKLFLDYLPKEKITYVVKGGPAVNDATMVDVKTIGLDGEVKVITTGANYQGVILEHCSDEMVQSFQEADLIISKGQANFETLSDINNKAIYYLMRAKCHVIAKEVGAEQGAFVMIKK